MENRDIYISQEGLKKLPTKNIDGKSYFWTTSTTTELPIFVSQDPGKYAPIETMYHHYQRAKAEFAQDNCYAHYNTDKKVWEFITFQESCMIVEKLAKLMIQFGISPRSCVGLLSYNRYEWNLAFWASVISDLVAFGIYMTNSPKECLHILNDSKSQIIFLEDQEQYDKIVKIKNQLTHLKVIITMEKVQPDPDLKTFYFIDLLQTPIESHVEMEFVKRSTNIKPGNCCILIYTSGTTGLSKGAMLSHDNLVTFSYNLDVGVIIPNS